MSERIRAVVWWLPHKILHGALWLVFEIMRRRQPKRYVDTLLYIWQETGVDLSGGQTITRHPEVSAALAAAVRPNKHMRTIAENIGALQKARRDHDSTPSEAA